jgi:tRNA modification GTPase
LINALSRREVAIVSDEPGTTRDLVEVALDLDGVKVRLIDTAGLRQDVSSAVERIGIERATKKAAQADLVLMLAEGSAAPELTLPQGVPAVRVATKLDLGSDGKPAWAEFGISTLTGHGVGELVAVLAQYARQAAGSTDILPFRERHVGYLRACVQSVENALAMRDSGLEECAELLRVAAAQLGRITGATDVEELLGTIFSKFCIGK